MNYSLFSTSFLSFLQWKLWPLAHSCGMKKNECIYEFSCGWWEVGKFGEVKEEEEGIGIPGFSLFWRHFLSSREGQWVQEGAVLTVLSTFLSIFHFVFPSVLLFFCVYSFFSLPFTLSFHLSVFLSRFTFLLFLSLCLSFCLPVPFSLCFRPSPTLAYNWSVATSTMKTNVLLWIEQWDQFNEILEAVSKTLY